MVSDRAMEGWLMSEEPIFEQLGNLLLERLRGEMVPAVLHQKDDIKLTHPGAETDYRFGVFLHDMEEVHRTAVLRPGKRGYAAAPGPSAGTPFPAVRKP